MSNSPVFKCHFKTKQPNLLNTGQMDPILFSYVLVRYFNGHCSTQDIAHKPTIWIPNHLKSKLQKVQYSNVSSIQIPTVLRIWKPDIQIPETPKKRMIWLSGFQIVNHVKTRLYNKRRALDHSKSRHVKIYDCPCTSLPDAVGSKYQTISV